MSDFKGPLKNALFPNQSKHVSNKVQLSKSLRSFSILEKTSLFFQSPSIGLLEGVIHKPRGQLRGEGGFAK